MRKESLEIKAEGLEKRFVKSVLFRNINFKIFRGETFYITGPNGAGKSTLLQIIAGIQKPTAGSVNCISGDKIVERESLREYIGFTGPQVNPYDSLTAVENLMFTSSRSESDEKINDYLEHFDLYRHRSKQVKYYSSGMKQRLRLIHAMINDPEILMLDEPCSNLDLKGRDIFYRLIGEIKGNKIIIIATNESEDINLCSKGIDLEQRNNR